MRVTANMQCTFSTLGIMWIPDETVPVVFLDVCTFMLYYG